MTRRRIAVIGSGVSGLTAAYILQRAADVTLYEADSRLGGHAHTHEHADAAGDVLGLDSGFIVHNRLRYPNLVRLFAELSVATQGAEMSMSVRCDGCGLEYAGGRGASGLLPRPDVLRRPRYLAMLAEVSRFHRRARRYLHRGESADETLGTFVRRGRFGRYFRAHFLTPLVAAVWSCPPALTEHYPARYLFEFLNQHGMLTVGGSLPWRTVSGGSAQYVRRAVKHLTAVHTNAPVRRIERNVGGALVHDANDQRAQFDAVVVATHPDQALKLLGRPSPEQAVVLGAFAYSTSSAVLHTDTSVLPRSARARASWNYRLPSCAADSARVHVSYDLTRLQRLPTRERYLVTLNDGGTIAERSVLDRMTYAHPVYTPAAVAAQGRLPGLNDGVLAFAGAYHGWGFHEDGCRSGVRAAASLGVDW